MKQFEMVEWLQLKKAGKMLAKLEHFVQPWVVEPWLQNASYQQIVLCLTGFSDCVLSVHFVRGKQVVFGTVPGALSALGTTIDFAYECNPIKA